MSEALAAVYPATTLQTCLRPRGGGARPVRRRAVGAPLSRHRGELASRLASCHPVFAFPPDVRKALYTTNALESVHARLRKILKTRGHFPTDEAATKLFWLARRNITATWGKEANFCRSARNQFAIVYGKRFTTARSVE
jgi:transposase-like protein